MSKLSFDKDKLNVLLLEGVHERASDNFKKQGYGAVRLLKEALEGDALREALQDTHILGIRSRTQLTKDVLDAAPKLLCAGCFCIGTNQVDLQAAKLNGVPIFNAPYANTRSVAELVLSEIIMLMRRIPEKSAAAHRGEWLKTADGAHEVRGKTLGIVGYGHIGSQLSIMAEAIGLNVIYYDIEDKLVIGNAQPVSSLQELLKQSDIVTLHVPDTDQTRGMIGENELSAMKKGAVLINAARGGVVDVDALKKSLDSGQIGGAALDVFPEEPTGKTDPFISDLRGYDNVILTPHIGGSTVEAQEGIAQEVTDRLIRYSDNGSTVGAVNFVQVNLPIQKNVTRFLHIHKNVPGVLSRLNDVFSKREMNIAGQYLRTDGEVGYVVVDIEGQIESGLGIRKELAAIDGTLRVRFLF